MNPAAPQVPYYYVVAQHFIQLYYPQFDTQRAFVHRLYHETAKVTRDGTTVEGAAQIEQYFRNYPSTRHAVKMVDPQPGFQPNSVVVNVSGDVEVNGTLKSFSQMFMLIPALTGSYGIFNDVCRTIPAGSIANGYGAPYGMAPMPIAPYGVPTPPPPGSVVANDADRRSIFIGHVEYQATEDDLRNLFARTGQIVRVTIKRDFQTKQSKGFAYIEFADDASAQNALSMDGTEFMGMNIKVTMKRTNIPGYSRGSVAMDGAPRGGRGGGRGRGGRGEGY